MSIFNQADSQETAQQADQESFARDICQIVTGVASPGARWMPFTDPEFGVEGVARWVKPLVLMLIIRSEHHTILSSFVPAGFGNNMAFSRTAMFTIKNETLCGEIDELWAGGPAWREATLCERTIREMAVSASLRYRTRIFAEGVRAASAEAE